MQPVCFLYNPTAGETVITEWLDTIISIYQRRGCTIVPYRLGFRAGEPELIADLLGHGYRHVLVAGGDGTVNYVVGIMKHHGIDLPVAAVSIEPAEPAFQTGPKATSIRSAHLQEKIGPVS